MNYCFIQSNKLKSLLAKHPLHPLLSFETLANRSGSDFTRVTYGADAPPGYTQTCPCIWWPSGGSDPEKHSLEGLRSHTTVFLIHVLRSYRCFFIKMLGWCRAFIIPLQLQALFAWSHKKTGIFFFFFHFNEKLFAIVSDRTGTDCKCGKDKAQGNFIFYLETKKELSDYSTAVFFFLV